MGEQTRIADAASMQAECDAIERAAQQALAQRRASREVTAYEREGWVVQEHPDGRIERLAPVGQFRAEDHPYPGAVPP